MKLKAKISLPFLIGVIIIGGIGLLSSCEKYVFQVETVDPGETILFQTQIQPVFNDKCVVCHRGSRNPDLRDGNSYESLSTGGFVTQPAENSRLYKQIISSSHLPFTLDHEKQLILLWIQQGAQNN